MAGNAHVELRTMDGSIIASKKVGRDGGVLISDLLPGSYKVVANSGLHQSVATVTISSFAQRLTIHLNSTPTLDQSQSVVSANSLAVPSKARKEVEASIRRVQKNDMAGAWDHVEKALHVSPKYAAALSLRGLLEMRQEHLEQAMADFSVSLENDRSDQLAYAGLAAGYNTKRQFDKALQVLEQGNSLASPLWFAHFEAGRALLGKQEFRLALAEGNRARNLLGRDVAVVDLLIGYSYLGLNDINSGRLELRQFLQQESAGPDADKVRAILTLLK